MARNRAFTSVRARIEIDGHLIAWAQGISGQETHTLIRIPEFGRYWPAEIEPGGGFIAGSLRVGRILQKPMESLGIWPRGADVNYIEFPPMTMILKDIVGDFAVRRIIGMRWETRSWDLQVGGAMTENATWAAIQPFTEDMPGLTG